MLSKHKAIKKKEEIIEADFIGAVLSMNNVIDATTTMPLKMLQFFHDSLIKFHQTLILRSCGILTFGNPHVITIY